MDTREDQPLEGRLIEEARERRNLSQNKAAKMAGMSGTRWRQIVYGEASGGPGIKNPVTGNAETIARMARVVEISPEDLIAADRQDAADELVTILRKELGQPETGPQHPNATDPHRRRLLELWPQAAEWQRRSIVGVLEEMLGVGARHPEPQQPEESRRTG